MVNDRQNLDLTAFAPLAGGGAVEWRISDAPVPYPEAVTAMETRVTAIADGKAAELVWLLEHPPLYTSGTSGKDADLLHARFPLFATGRGGQLTYHGPGQRVAYVMLDLKRRRPDVRAYVASLEQWIIRALAAFNVRGERREDRVGVWVARPDKGRGHEDKIAAIGVRLRRWVAFHGVSINVEPNLEHFSAIVPCGVIDPRYGVTSLVDLGLPVTMADVDIALRQAFEEVFGPVKALTPQHFISNFLDLSDEIFQALFLASDRSRIFALAIYFIFNSGPAVTCVWGFAMAARYFGCVKIHDFLWRDRGYGRITHPSTHSRQWKRWIQRSFQRYLSNIHWSVVLISTLGAVYIMVRGFDNIKRGWVGIRQSNLLDQS
jgi:lipoyl(octanoyl) transferase